MTAITRVWPGHDPNEPRPAAENEYPQLLYLGEPGPGHLVLSASREPGTDEFGNAYPAGITLHDDAIPADGDLLSARLWAVFGWVLAHTHPAATIAAALNAPGTL